jgi:hypothetical protein
VGVGKADVVIALYKDQLPIVFPHGDFYGTGTVLQKCVGEILGANYEIKKSFEVNTTEIRVYSLIK